MSKKKTPNSKKLRNINSDSNSTNVLEFIIIFTAISVFWIILENFIRSSFNTGNDIILSLIQFFLNYLPIAELHLIFPLIPISGTLILYLGGRTKFSNNNDT